MGLTASSLSFEQQMQQRAIAKMASGIQNVDFFIVLEFISQTDLSNTLFAHAQFHEAAHLGAAGLNAEE